MTGAGSLQAVVLCGGKGERLRPLTQDLPKPLVPIKGKPLLGHIVEHIQKYGIRKIIATVGYKADKVEKYLKDELKIRAEIVDSGDADIIKRLQDCESHLQGDFLVLYGDTLSNVDLEKLAAFHRSHPEKATVTVWPLQSQFGVFDVDKNGKITSFKEKPVLDKWINIGYFYFRKETLAWMRDFKRFEDFLGYLAAERKMNAYRHQGIHVTVNTVKELEEAEANIDRFLGH